MLQRMPKSTMIEFLTKKVYHCAYCKGVVLKTDHYCQYCGKKLRKQSFFGCFAHYINEKLAKRFTNKRDGF